MVKRQLKHSLSLNFIAAGIVPMFLLSLTILVYLASDTKNEAVEKSQLLANTVSGQVEIFLNKPLSIMENIGAMLHANPNWNEQTVQQVLDLHIRDTALFESIYLLDEQGIVVNTGLPSGKERFHDEFIGINLAHLPFYKTTLASGDTTWSDTFLSVISGKMSLALSIKVDRRILIGNLSIRSLADFIENLSAGRNIQIGLVDNSGTIIVHPDPIIADTLVNVSNLPIVQNAFDGREETSTFTFNNTKYIGSVKKITGPNWLVFVTQAAKEAYRPVSTTALFFLLGAIAAILLSIIFAVLKAEKIISPIQEVASRSHEIASGNYNVSFSPSPYIELQALTGNIREMADAVQRREKQLQMSQKRFRQIYNATNEAIFIRNIQTNMIIEANQAMQDLFGYTLDELTNLTIADLSTGDPLATQKKAQEKITKAMREGLQVYEWNYRRKDGDSFWAEVTLKKAEIDGRQRVLGVIRDITERKTLEQQLAQSQKMEAIGTLAGGIAHDFNNILTPIMGYIELAKIHSNDAQRQQGDLDQVLKAVQRAKELVQQILTFSRQEGQQATPTEVSIIIREALKLLRSSIPSTIEIRQNIDPSCGSVLANPTQIHQVLMNLCTNAYHAMRDKGGILGVSLTPVIISSSENPALKKLPQGSYLRLEVSDTGLGMDNDTISRILEPYFTTKKKGEGTGLGLSVVLGIVKGLGGELTIYSEVGKGSTFHIYLPMIETQQQLAAAGILEPPPGGEETILLVDDDETILRVQNELLLGLGYKVETFANPEEALEAFMIKPDFYDLVVTDMTMPKMTGDILADKMRQIKPGLPIILCTGFSEIINRDNALAMGINEFLTKPIELSQLAHTLRKVLENKPA